jgi:hypothetical protein
MASPIAGDLSRFFTAICLHEASSTLGITAHRLNALGLIDRIVPEPVGGAYRDPTLKGNRAASSQPARAISCALTVGGRRDHGGQDGLFLR